MPNTLILCDCSGSQKLNAKALAKATGMGCSRIHTALCTAELGEAAAFIKAEGATIACLQEHQIFEELADELGAEAPAFVDLRDRAGWSEEGGKSAPKMAALLAESALTAPVTKTFDIESAGQCLIIGSEAVALAAAAQLSDVLTVTVLLESAEDLPVRRDFDVVIGQLRSASGGLGQFEVKIGALQMVQPGGRGAPQLSAPRDGGQSECDIILDLRGDTPLFHHKRDGYLRADPRHADAVSKAIFEASQLVGEFEKPFYVALDPHICAHTRSGITGCSNCMNTCETGAISAAGEHVEIDPMVCAGCGGCASACPSGAITYQVQESGYQMQRIEIMAKTYREAGGEAPRLLVHDAEFGGEMISLSARFGRGLPADVIPLEVEALTTFGHAEMLAALGCGFAAVDLLLTPKTERPPLESAHALALAISDNAAIRLLDIADPDALSEALYGQPIATPCAPILPIGNRRQVTRLAAKALRGELDAPIALPAGAPHGAVVVNTDKCTLCLSCVSLCPSGALLDNEDTPQLRFQEDACLQCGICSHACPENAISLQPQLDLSDAAFSQRVLHEEDPFACISCGSLFGVKSSVERIIEKLADKHPMFTGSDNAKLIQMCDKCRVEAQFGNTTNPFQGGARPVTRTTDDYLKERDS
ncbi:MAG: (4Fe-4S)-binding protein [Rhodobacteraceae bacterium]|nr:(4Fe-4S)-binding protein [Paracoccaceae bacterium]